MFYGSCFSIVSQNGVLAKNASVQEGMICILNSKFKSSDIGKDQYMSINSNRIVYHNALEII